MDVASMLKSAETIASALKEIAPHLKQLNIGALSSLSRTGSSGLVPVVLVGGAAVAIGAGLGMLFSPRAGADLRKELRERAKSLTAKVQGAVERQKEEAGGAGGARSTEALTS